MESVNRPQLSVFIRVGNLIFLCYLAKNTNSVSLVGNLIFLCYLAKNTNSVSLWVWKYKIQKSKTRAVFRLRLNVDTPSKINLSSMGVSKL